MTAAAPPPLRPSWQPLLQADRMELRWLWMDAAAEIGLRSACGAQLDRARARLPPEHPDPAALAVLDHESRQRLSRVLRKLAPCSPVSVRVLRLYCAPESDPDLPFEQRMRVTNAAGERGLLMLLTPELEAWRLANEPAHTAVHALVTLSLRPREARAMQAVRMGADALLAKACEHYGNPGNP